MYIYIVTYTTCIPISNRKLGIGIFRGGSASEIVPGLRGVLFFWCKFLLHFWAIWENDPFSKSEKVPGLKPQAA